MPHDWPAGDDDADASPDGRACERCGTAVSHAFHRQWADNDDRLNGCPECLPRSFRFGKDIYDRDVDEDFENFDKDAPNANQDPAPSHRILDDVEGDDE